MLIEKPLSPDDIACLKLANGDEVIAKLVETTVTTVSFTKPMLMMVGQDPRTGQPGVSMAPFWILGADRDSTFKINMSNIICMVQANQDAKANYIKATTGLTVPGAGSSLTL